MGLEIVSIRQVDFWGWIASAKVHDPSIDVDDRHDI
jgi:hypothetical protein